MDISNYFMRYPQIMMGNSESCEGQICYLIYFTQKTIKRLSDRLVL